MIEFSPQGFRSFLNSRVKSSDSYYSYLNSIIDENQWKFLKNGESLLDYICRFLNNEIEKRSDSNFNNVIQGEIRLIKNRFDELISEAIDSDDLKRAKDLRNRKSALSQFEEYALELNADFEEEREEIVELESKNQSSVVEKTFTDSLRDGGEDEIEWFEIKEKYFSDRIYPSQKRSIWENFKFRLTTQNRSNIFLIREYDKIFKNLWRHSKSQTNQDGLYQELVDRYNTAIDFILGRILFYVKEDNGNERGLTFRVPDGMWAYPLSGIKELGFSKHGTLYIKLNNNNNEIKKVWTNSPERGWYEMKNINCLKDIELDHDPRMEDVLNHIKDELKTLKVINALCPFKKAQLKNPNDSAWGIIIPNLKGLVNEIIYVLSYYNLDALSRKDNRDKH